MKTIFNYGRLFGRWICCDGYFLDNNLLLYKELKRLIEENSDALERGEHYLLDKRHMALIFGKQETSVLLRSLSISVVMTEMRSLTRQV